MIRKQIKLFFFVLLMLILALFVCLWSIFSKEQEISYLEKNRYELYSLFISKKRNFEDFSTLINRHIINEDKTYEEALRVFLEVDTKENLKTKRDLFLQEYDVFRDHEVSPEQVKNIQEFFKTIGFKEEVFNKIFKAEAYTKAILHLDIEALNALYGFFKDGQGSFSIKKEPSRKFARDILYSQKYLILKKEVEANIDEIFAYTSSYMQEYISAQKEEENKLYNVAFIILALIIATLFAGMFFANERLIKAFEVLMSWTKEVQKGNFSFEHKSSYQKDEIGVLMHSFSVMAKTVRCSMSELEELATKDTLTKLYNRRVLKTKLFDANEHFKRYKTDTSVILLDIDHFKSVNDTYGHNVGDSVLKEVAKILQAGVRKTDTLGRWGGEEFLLLLPSTNHEQAKVLAEHLRKSIQEYSFKHVGTKTASFGVYCFKEGLSIKDVIAKADDALYEAKEKGRNRVC